MGGETIRANGEFLDALYRTISRVATNLGAGTSVPRCDFSASPDVDRAWERLYSRWDENQQRASSNLEAIAANIKVIRDAFAKCDAELATSIEGSP